MSSSRANASIAKSSRAGRRGRPSRAEEREITERIVSTALRLFVTEGYGATSMKRIGDEAGVAPNTLYARFADKAVLFSAIIEWKAATWKITNPPRRARVGAPLVEILEVSALGMLEAIEREDIKAIGRLLDHEAARFPELAEIYGDSALSVGLEEFIHRVEHAPDCRLSREAAYDLVSTLREAVVGYSHMRIFGKTPPAQANHRAAARRIARVVGRGWDHNCDREPAADQS